MIPFPPVETFADLIRLAVAEDLGDAGDVTSALTVPADRVGVGTLYQKSAGVVCGLPIVSFVCEAFDVRLEVEAMRPGDELLAMEGRYGDRGPTPLMRVRGPMRSLLAAERTLLNFVQRMSGIATLTHRFVQAVAGTRAKILDTRKTLPGYRSLDKYAVLTGGGQNHRIGLFDMVLVKDNHLAQLTMAEPTAWADRLQAMVRASKADRPALPIEIEVVDEAQFARVLTMPGVDIILLDNMNTALMARCVAARDASEAARHVQLEASGGVNLDTVAAIARTGVDRISVGALTHSVTGMDISFEIEDG